MHRLLRGAALAAMCVSTIVCGPAAADHLRDLQTDAMTTHRAAWGHWGANPDRYNGWFSHSNRLIPIYSFGMTLDEVKGEKSLYRDAQRLEELYGRLPEDTLNPNAEYFDQTDVYRLQKAAAAAGKKYIVLMVFDGMDWQTTQAAAIEAAGNVAYREGRGTGLAFQDYQGATTDFGYFVTSPHNEGTSTDVSRQTVANPGGKTPGGYDFKRGGSAPWETPTDRNYLISASREQRQAYTDSAASATSLNSGIKTYNDSINVDHLGRQVKPVSHDLQEQGYAIGVVTSVPISHATPACAYAHNVNRSDYQDITRDLVGLPSVSHPSKPLPGVDVLIGTGAGEAKESDSGQGDNFAAGRRHISDADLAAIDAAQGGKYRVAERTAGQNGRELLLSAANEAAANNQRLFGLFGHFPGFGDSHLPFATADGKYDPTNGLRGSETYTEADIAENPTLADMTEAALTVLDKNPKGFWLMVEAGEVDWANHDNNLDNSIGAVKSGAAAFEKIVDWVEKHDAWNDTAVFVTADHGHYLFLTQPEALLDPTPTAAK